MPAFALISYKDISVVIHQCSLIVQQDSKSFEILDHAIECVGVDLRGFELI